MTDFITPSELAKRWGIKGRTLERWRWQRVGIKYIKIGHLIRYRMEDVLAYEAQNETSPHTA